MKTQEIIKYSIAGAVALGILTGGVGIAYRQIWGISADKERDRKNEVSAEITRQIVIETCVDTAITNYQASWNNSCSMLKEKPDCNLPLYLADRHEEKLKEEKELCYKR